jgi:hypothetical protein
VEKFKGTDKFGFTELKVADGLLELLKDYLTGMSLHGGTLKLHECRYREVVRLIV